MFKMLWGGLILILVTACAPAQIPVPVVEVKTPEPEFWQGFPLMPGGVEIDDDIGAYHYTVIADVDTIVKFYRKQMAGTQWGLLGMSKTNEADMETAVMWFANNESTVSLQVWSKAVLTHVAFIIDARYPTPKP